MSDPGRNQVISAIIGLLVPLPIMAGISYWLLSSDPAPQRGKPSPAAVAGVMASAAGATATVAPKPTPTPLPRPTPSLEPAATPTPMAQPPTPKPTTQRPTAPAARPTAAPTVRPTAAPTIRPSAAAPIVASDDNDLDGHAWRRLSDAERQAHAEGMFKAYLILGRGRFASAPAGIQDATVRAALRSGDLVDGITRFYTQNPTLQGRPVRQVVQDLAPEAMQRYLKARP